jgi:hypothetical protein
MKKPVTDRVAILAVRKLSEWAAQGYSPTEIIETSIMNGWQGLFLPKTATPKPAEKVTRRAREYV